MFCKKFSIGFVLFIVILFLSTDLFAQTTEDDEVIKVDVSLVNIPFSVSDRDGRSILGLNLENFTLFEDGKLQKIEYLSTQDTPLNIVLLLDTSQSAQENFDKIKNAATAFIKQLRPLDRCMIITFDEVARVKSEFTSNQIKLDKAIKRTVLSQKPGTLMRDTIIVTVDNELAKVKGRKAIVLITDGKDAGSAISKTDLLFKLGESDAPIYSVLYEIDHIILRTTQPTNAKEPTQNQNYQASQKQINRLQTERRKRNDEAAEYLGKVSDVTGGRMYRKEIDNLGEAFNNITEELRKQYLISFYPDDSNYNVSKHQLKVKVDKKDAVVRMKNYTLLKAK